MLDYKNVINPCMQAMKYVNPNMYALGQRKIFKINLSLNQYPLFIHIDKRFFEITFNFLFFFTLILSSVVCNVRRISCAMTAHTTIFGLMAAPKWQILEDKNSWYLRDIIKRLYLQTLNSYHIKCHCLLGHNDTSNDPSTVGNCSLLNQY